MGISRIRFDSENLVVKMDSKTIIEQVKECQKNNWKNSDLGKNSEELLEEIAYHFETCEECRKDFDSMEYPEEWLIDFEERLSGTSINDWTCEKKPLNKLTISGFESREFIVRSGSNSSARINVPLDWQGKKVMVVRLE